MIQVPSVTGDNTQETYDEYTKPIATRPRPTTQRAKATLRDTLCAIEHTKNKVGDSRVPFLIEESSPDGSVKEKSSQSLPSLQSGDQPWP